MTLKRIEIEESKPLDIETAKLFENLIQAKEKLAAKPTEFLGLYKTEKGIYANFYIGHWWIEEGKRYLWVKPRIFSFRDKRVTTDITRILEEIFRDEEVSKEFLKSMEHSDETKRVFGFDFVSQPIIVDKREIPNIKIFVVIAFLKTLTEIVNKGFRRDYIKVNRTLKNRVKGKILISQSLKQHLKRGLPLTNTCSYHEHSINSLENRILKTALLQVKNYFAKDREGKAFASSILKGSLVFLLREFESIEPFGGGKTIRNHFRKVRHNALFPEYKRALKLAKVILGFEDDKIEIPPYYINMWKLFELYVFKNLRESYDSLYQETFVLGEIKVKLIPDFLIKDLKAIADAKYTFVKSPSEISKKDLEQLSFYGRITSIRNKVSDNELQKNCKEPKLILIYPKPRENNETINVFEFNPLNDLENFELWYCYLPVRNI